MAKKNNNIKNPVIDLDKVKEAAKLGNTESVVTEEVVTEEVVTEAVVTEEVVTEEVVTEAVVTEEVVTEEVVTEEVVTEEVKTETVEKVELRKFKIIPIGMSLTYNRVGNHGDIITELDIEVGNIDKLISKGFIKEV